MLKSRLRVLPTITHAPSSERALGYKIQLILLSIQLPMREPKRRAEDGGEDGNDHVIPNEQRVGGEGDKGLADGVGDGAHEEEDGRDDGAHVLGGLGEGVFEPRDGGEDLGEGDEDVGDSLPPHIDRGRARAVRIRWIVAARAQFVDVVLHHAGGDHGRGRGDETPGDLLQRGEADADALEARIDENVANGDEDDKSDGIDVVDEIIGSSMEFHGCGLGDEIIGHLVVGEPPDRVPEEDSAGFEAPTDFVDPDVIKSHPRGLPVAQSARLHGFPEIIGAHVHNAVIITPVS